MNACHQYVAQIHELFLSVKQSNPFIHLLNDYGSEMPLIQHELTSTGPLRQCFMNATHCALEHGFTYCEGYAQRKDLIPLMHAWVLDDQGNVIDPTWDGPAEYFGLPFKEQFLLDTIQANGVYGIGESLYMFKMSPDQLIEHLYDGLALD